MLDKESIRDIIIHFNAEVSHCYCEAVTRVFCTTFVSGRQQKTRTPGKEWKNRKLPASEEIHLHVLIIADTSPSPVVRSARL